MHCDTVFFILGRGLSVVLVGPSQCQFLVSIAHNWQFSLNRCMVLPSYISRQWKRGNYSCLAYVADSPPQNGIVAAGWNAVSAVCSLQHRLIPIPCTRLQIALFICLLSIYQGGSHDVAIALKGVLRHCVLHFGMLEQFGSGWSVPVPVSCVSCPSLAFYTKWMHGVSFLCIKAVIKS